MKNRRIHIHIGFPKTGTTSIQESLYLNHQALKDELDVDYCPRLCSQGKHPSSKAHHAIAWEICNKYHPYYSKVDHELIRQNLEEPGNYLLSSEWFSMAKNEHVEEMTQRWALPTDRTAVALVRDEPSHIRSSWMQSVKMGTIFLSLREYYLRVYKKNRAPLSRKLAAWLNNDFSVVLIAFNDLSHNDMGLQFDRNLYHRDINEGRWQRAPRVNVSPQPETLDNYRKLSLILSPMQHLLGRAPILPPAFKQQHDRYCRYDWLKRLPGKAVQRDYEFIRNDLETLESIYDL